jgi:prepilin peptidase CpaA
MPLMKELVMGACPKCGSVLPDVPPEAAPPGGTAVAAATCPTCAARGDAEASAAKTATDAPPEAKETVPAGKAAIYFYDLLALCGAVAYLISPAAWPLLFVSAAMIVAAYIDGWKLKVPNWLTYRIILSGWVLGLIYDLTQAPGTISPDDAYYRSRLLASVGVTLFGFLIFVPIYIIGGVGAGDVKMQMGFGAWIGAFCGLDQGMRTVGYGYVIGILVGGVLAVIMMVVLGQYKEYAKNTREILLDLAGSGGNISAVAEKAAQRKSRQTLLPYGIPLCIGYLTYLVFHYFFA